MKDKRLKISKLFFWVIIIFLIILRYFSTRPVYKTGDTVRITTTVMSDPMTFGDYQTFSAAGIKVYLPRHIEINYGDRIILKGEVIDGKLKKAKLISAEEFKSIGSGVRKQIISFYQNVLPEPLAGLTAGVTLGSKNALTPDFWNSVKKVGVAHVVVASGTNVTFVVAFIFGITSLFISRGKSIPIVILSCVLYLFISGFQPPLIRAAIMAVVAFWAESRGRLLSAWRNLFLTGGVMLIIEPDWVTDIGFILSFVSTASIMLFEKRIAKILKFLPKFINEGFSTSFAAQIGVCPILFVTFGQFNPFSPFINALVLWTVPYIMIFGAIGGVIGLVIPLFGKLILYISYPLSWWFAWVVGIFS